jgi:competence protein ComEC
MISGHQEFWRRHPAFLVGVNLLIGTSSFLFWDAPCNWLLSSLWCIYQISLRFWPSLFLVSASAAYSIFLYSPTPETTKEIKAYFSISSLQPQQTPFQKRFLYKGTLFFDSTRIPCSVSINPQNRPLADKDYLLTGTLLQRAPYQYGFKPKQWMPIEGTRRWAESRYQMKEALRRFLETKLPSPRTATLLSSLLTGDVEDRSLRYEFSRIGLQHLLAISGFHFGLLIAFCSFFLGLILPSRWKILALLIAVNLYFLFVGSSPAVLRSWLTATLYLCGKLIGRHTTGINLLGASMGAETLIDPLCSANLGFQLSFLSCLGILLFHPIFEAQLQRALPKRNPLEADNLTVAAKHGYLLASLLRQSLSLTLAVNLAIFPLLLFHFHSFPLLSLLYNLFFPALLSIALFSLLLSLLLQLIWPFGASFFFQITDFFTAQLLDLSAYPPLALDFSFHVLALPAWAIPCFIFLIVCIAIQYRNKKIS